MTLIEEIKQHAYKHYNDEFFWSSIVECYTDDELQASIDSLNVKTLTGFIRKTVGVRDVLEDRWNDTKNTIAAFGEAS